MVKKLSRVGYLCKKEPNSKCKTEILKHFPFMLCGTFLIVFVYLMYTNDL